MKDLVIGIDVGGQSTKLGVVNEEGEIIAQTVISSLQKVEALIAKNDKETMDNLRDITANINSKL